MPKGRRVAEHSPPDSRLNETVRVLGLLGHPGRLRVLYALAASEHSSGELCALTGESTVTFHHHLSLIRAAGLVRGERDGRLVRYSLSALGRAAVAAARVVGAAER